MKLNVITKTLVVAVIASLSFGAVVVDASPAPPKVSTHTPASADRPGANTAPTSTTARAFHVVRGPSPKVALRPQITLKCAKAIFQLGLGSLGPIAPWIVAGFVTGGVAWLVAFAAWQGLLFWKVYQLVLACR